MTAFIEYDEQQAYFNWYAKHPDAPQDASELLPPFAPNTDINSLTMERGLYTGSKNYQFFAAIAGVRNETGIEPLYSPRGLPPTLSTPVAVAVEQGVFRCRYRIGWLTLEEINTALNHQAVNPDHLSNQTLTILDIMDILERRYGVNRVRLIFGFC